MKLRRSYNTLWSNLSSRTPEGPNVGLIASLATYARVNKYGFIETHRKCVDGKVTNDVSFYSATAEKGYTVSQAAIEKDKEENITAKV